MTAQVFGVHHGHRQLDEPAAVRFTPQGRPLALRWHGRIWQVVGRPATAAAAAPSATGWRFSAQTGPASPVLEFGITFDAARDGWRLVSVGGGSDRPPS
jgi:hypothetical protein